jgi:lysophospholipase L1-like esterase
MNTRTAILLVVLLAVCGCATHSQKSGDAVSSATPSSSGSEIVLYMAGDSTMADKPVIPANPERGWGQLLPLYFKPGVRVENHAANGRSSKSFRDEGKWQVILDRIKPGNYVIIQFGHNDEPGKGPQRYTEPFGSYTSNLVAYVQETRVRSGIPILATSVARRKFDDQGKLIDTHGDYIVATRQVAEKLNVPLLDLNKDTSELLSKMGDEQTKRLYDWIPPGEFAQRPDGLKDDTHFNAFGASRVCDLAVEEMNTAVPALAVWLKR